MREEKLVRKIMKREMQWQNRFLSFGARYILVAHVLQTIPVYLLSVMNTPGGVINQIHKSFARFFGEQLQITGKYIGGLVKFVFT